MRYPTGPELLKCCPGASPAIIGAVAAALPQVAAACEIDTINRLASFLGQAACETDGFKTFEEYASGKAYEHRRDLGNVNPGDGRRFKGRGAFQLTGRANYSAATAYVARALNMPGLDLEKTPELVAKDKAIGLATACWFWKTRSINALADTNNTVAVTRKINGGTNGLESRMLYTARIKAIISRPSAVPVAFKRRITGMPLKLTFTEATARVIANFVTSPKKAAFHAE